MNIGLIKSYMTIILLIRKYKFKAAYYINKWT